MFKLPTWIVLVLGLFLAGCGGGGGAAPAANVPPSNQSPTANAGAGQSINEGMTVVLSGTGTDSDGTIASYAWQQDSGRTVNISNSNMANASFVAPAVSADESFVFRLTVTDNEGTSASDTVTISVIDRSAEWDAFLASLETRITEEQIQLEIEQEADQYQPGNPGFHMVKARDRIVVHVRSFFDFFYVESVRLATSQITFPRAEVIDALSEYQGMWQVYLNEFLSSSFFNCCDMELVRADVTSAIEFAYVWTVDRLDAYSTSRWQQLIVSLHYQFIFEQEALDFEQNRAPAQTSGSNLVASRDRFIGHVDLFFDFVYDDTIRLTNSGELFSRNEVVGLLDTYQNEWELFLDWWLTSSPYFHGYGTNDLDAIFIPGALAAIEDAVENTLSRLDAAGRLN